MPLSLKKKKTKDKTRKIREQKETTEILIQQFKETNDDKKKRKILEKILKKQEPKKTLKINNISINILQELKNKSFGRELIDLYIEYLNRLPNKNIEFKCTNDFNFNFTDQIQYRYFIPYLDERKIYGYYIIDSHEKTIISNIEKNVFSVKFKFLIKILKFKN
jgi:hypothetical protein